MLRCICHNVIDRRIVRKKNPGCIFGFVMSSPEQLDVEDKELQARVKAEQEHQSNVISFADTIPTLATIDKIAKSYKPSGSDAGFLTSKNIIASFRFPPP